MSISKQSAQFRHQADVHEDDGAVTVSTPGVRMTDEEDGKELDAECGACYWSWTMRVSDIRRVRCELQFAVKELARRMQKPDAKNLQALKRVVRLLTKSPRCPIVCGRQAEQPVVGRLLRP